MPIYKGSQKINTLYVGGGVKKVYYGSTLVFGKEVFEHTFTANGTVTFPASMFSLKVIVVGSGGSGGNYGAVNPPVYVGGGGGGAGGYCEKLYTVAEIQNLKGKQVSFTVGAVPAKFASGNASRFLNQVANGGSAGANYVTQKGGAGGTASGGDINNTGSSGGNGNYNHVGDPAPGWTIGGGTYGTGGGGYADWQSGQGGVGCVYIRFEY